MDVIFHPAHDDRLAIELGQDATEVMMQFLTNGPFAKESGGIAASLTSRDAIISGSPLFLRYDRLMAREGETLSSRDSISWEKVRARRSQNNTRDARFAGCPALPCKGPGRWALLSPALSSRGGEGDKTAALNSDNARACKGRRGKCPDNQLASSSIESI
jgi:hypothetical protein